MTAGKVMLYGAYGYTAKLIAEEARFQGLEFIAAGRRADAVKEVADQYGAEDRVFALEDHAEIERQLADIDILISTAGPFKTTAPRVIDACIATGTHYLDITGEFSVFAHAETRDDDAKGAGVMLMPGAGWDVVASDGIALHTARRVENPVRLRLAVWHNEHFVRPRASSYTLNDILRQKLLVRRAGELVVVEDAPTLEFDIGTGTKTFYPYPMADVICSWKSTGVPDISVYTGANIYEFSEIPLEAIAQMPSGPDAETRAKIRSFTFAEAVGADGSIVTSLHDSVAAYDFTAYAIVNIVQKIRAGDLIAGFQSPSSAYGTRIIEETRGTRIVDLT